MEKIQERGLRFVYGGYTSDYDSLLCKSKMPKLKLGRERNIAIQTYNSQDSRVSEIRKIAHDMN